MIAEKQWRELFRHRVMVHFDARFVVFYDCDECERLEVDFISASLLEVIPVSEKVN